MKTVLIIIASVFLAVALGQLLNKSADNVKTESAFARVLESGTLRCGYALWPKYLEKDPNTGTLSGLSVDYVEELAKSLNLKVEWAEEVGWAEFAEALKHGRIDAFCFTAWQNAQRTRVVNFVRPLFYTPLYAYARMDDTRFDGDYPAIDDPSVTISSVDGSTVDVLAKEAFPKAKTASLPEGMSSSAQMMMNVVNGKADVTMVDYTTYLTFEKNNPGQLRQVEGPPLRLTGASLMVAKGEYDLQEMLSAATDQLIGGAVIDKLFVKNGFMEREVVPIKLQ